MPQYETVPSGLVDAAIRQFADFLNSAWVAARTLMPGDVEETQAAWGQANWELLVEASLGRRLYPYNGGADIYPDSSRVTEPNAEPTHAIACRPLDIRVVDRVSNLPVSFPDEGFLLEEFVSFRDSRYAREPPFDFVRVVTYSTEYVFKSSDLCFVMREFSEDER